MKLVPGTVAAITGAGSGIGRALALNLAGSGCALAIADVQRVTLEETAELARAAGAHAVTTHVCDVSDFASVESYAADASAAHRGVQLLVNNAGVALGGSFQDISRGAARLRRTSLAHSRSREPGLQSAGSMRSV